MLPQDDFILLSYLNAKLRDFYPNLSALCEDLDLSREELETRLSSLGFRYDETCNQFV
ncbi:DUF4250 domain-containing protein [Candidatus Borkfalkia ceftriaxoniphila]|uniref:DUF4250 domain-containing protein n=1 Tax=Candidatus Borkfalkia ceftriaxoniphila TaxID=2508949 RepID=A0A4Q2KE34_9FIRM|nr:DUF4250 domain-containing protein [Candidatus Borkfalkia ceftriaxoniphila]RXZ61471.1 DUF4250 domain-containing protein [Candidatus Borkfalkia ceftriaxoniphila]